MKVFIVMGSSGSYSDKREWPVVAYLDEKLAEEHVELANKRAEELHYKYASSSWEVQAKMAEQNELDPECRIGSVYDKSWYDYMTVELKDQLPAKEEHND